MTTFPCCPHCVDDQPHIELDAHDVPCDVDNCQTPPRAARYQLEDRVQYRFIIEGVVYNLEVLDGGGMEWYVYDRGADAILGEGAIG